MDTNALHQFVVSRDLCFLGNEYFIPRLFCVQARGGLDANWMVFVDAILCPCFFLSCVDV